MASLLELERRVETEQLGEGLMASFLPQRRPYRLSNPPLPSSLNDQTSLSCSSTSTYASLAALPKPWDLSLSTLRAQIADQIRPTVDKYEQAFPALLEIPSKDHPYGAFRRRSWREPGWS